MSSLLLSLSRLEKYLSEGMKGRKFNTDDSQYTFNTTTGLIQALEVLKKRGTLQYAFLKGNLYGFCDSGISQLGLDQYEIVKALEDQDFVDSYISHATNPFDTARVLSITYNENCWGDREELISQL